MPLYDYACERCGEFRDWRSMSQYGDPAICPVCGGAAPRIVSAPYLATMDRGRRLAHERNEKSADAPEVMSRKEMDRLGAKRAGARGRHHHAHGHHHRSAGRYPWMIGH